MFLYQKEQQIFTLRRHLSNSYKASHIIKGKKFLHQNIVMYRYKKMLRQSYTLSFDAIREC